MNCLVKSLFDDKYGISSEAYDNLIFFLESEEEVGLLEWIFANVKCVEDRYYSE